MLRRPINRDRGKGFEFSSLLITVKFVTLQTHGYWHSRSRSLLKRVQFSSSVRENPHAVNLARNGLPKRIVYGQRRLSPTIGCLASSEPGYIIIDHDWECCGRDSARRVYGFFARGSAGRTET